MRIEIRFADAERVNGLSLSFKLLRKAKDLTSLGRCKFIEQWVQAHSWGSRRRGQHQNSSIWSRQIPRR
ncbi:hypothetical protein Ae201684_002710 [Aphanomyces euteiches]|uniref:Uncharacterized protein n=1 Tax=Aphanomyces euteiches TaxID=100861 RepID=A0A6G0XPV8_9STRA|nr:hypothetical protein Ae201684_002710 [Aphanomyces euteiches]